MSNKLEIDHLPLEATYPTVVSSFPLSLQPTLTGESAHMFKVVTLVAVAALLSGCKPITDAFYQAFYSGTLEGVDACVEGMQTNLVSAETAKAYCISQYEAPLPYSAMSGLDGNGGPQTVWGEKVFSGTIKNKTERFVVTAIALDVTIYDKEGKQKQTVYASVKGWFEPKTTTDSFTSIAVQGAPDDWGQETFPFCKFLKITRRFSSL